MRRKSQSTSTAKSMKNSLSVNHSLSKTPIDTLSPTLKILAMQTLNAISEMYLLEFEERYQKEYLKSKSEKHPTYGIVLADDGKKTVYGYLSMVNKKGFDIAVLLDFRIV